MNNPANILARLTRTSDESAARRYALSTSLARHYRLGAGRCRSWDVTGKASWISRANAEERQAEAWAKHVYASFAF